MNKENKAQTANQENSNQFIDQIIQTIINNNPYGFILRPKLKEKTGGLLNGRTMANLDCLGKGIKTSFKVGRRTAYPIEAVVEYLREKVSINE